MSAQVDTGQKLKEMGDEEREKFIQAIAQSLIQNARENGNNAVNMESQANAGSGNGNRAARCRELKKASRASKKKNHDKPLKPLNSFMAYRTFVTTAFPGVAQKVKSGFAEKMWKEETRNIWILLAQAYSQARDKARLEKQSSVNCEEFITSAASFIGLPLADAFVEITGWKMIDGENNDKTVERIGPIGKGTTLKSVSVDDIVKHCYANGIAPRPTQASGSNAGNNVSIAFMAAPETVDEFPSKAEITTEEQGTTGNVVAISVVAAPNATHDASVSTEIMTEERVIPEADIMQEVTEPGDVADNAHLPLRHDEVFIEQQSVLTASGEQYPFNLQFHPEIDQPALALDFDMIQDSFDAFDVDATFNVVDWEEWIDFGDGSTTSGACNGIADQQSVGTDWKSPWSVHVNY